MGVAYGTFRAYQSSGKADYPSDEEATDSAFTAMLQLCGNPGQETLIGEHFDFFFDWAVNALEEESAEGTVWEDFAAMVLDECYDGRVDKWQGTEVIWGYGWVAIADQSGFHDSGDEYGEGTGQTF